MPSLPYTRHLLLRKPPEDRSAYLHQFVRSDRPKSRINAYLHAMIIMYTDGAAKGNPGPGGYGVVLMTADKKHRKELSDGFRLTTNNRMELLAVIIGLESLKKPGMKVKIYSDSKYVVDAVEKGWVFNWEKKGFAKKANPDLWKRFLRIYRQHSVTFQWVKGHANIPENERCDELAVAAAEMLDLPADEGYEQSLKDKQGMY